jgi:hypothetical protein
MYGGGPPRPVELETNAVMNDRWVRVPLAAVLLAAMPLLPAALLMPATAWAQMEEEAPVMQPDPPRPNPPLAGQRRPARMPPTQALQPELDATDQLSPRQIAQPAMPSGSAASSGSAGPSGSSGAVGSAGSAAPMRSSRPVVRAAAASAAAMPGARAVACSGVFAADSTHLKLATTFDSKNVTFSEVDGPDGTKLNASVLFPNDPKRRLEVLWQNEVARSGTSLIVITAQSSWAAPKGLHLGMPLATLEKLNGKPFTLAGLDKDSIAAVKDWQGGALDKLAGGCKIGVHLAPDPKAPETARTEVTGDKELLSNDTNLRAVRPIIAEIIVGY